MKNPKLRFPLRLILLDLVGCLFIALGLAEWFAVIGLVPEPLRFRYFEFALIALGVVLAMPLVTNIAEQIKNNSKTNRPE